MELKTPPVAEDLSRSALEFDRRRFRAFEESLTRNGSIAFLRDHHMGGPFDPAALVELRRFCDGAFGSGQGFRDRRLERKRRQLVRRCQKFLQCVGEHTAVGQGSMRSVPLIWEEEAPRKLDHVVYLLHRLAERVVRSYEDLVASATARLGP
jgi:hypothetical protein